jgi:hypothetical protein
LPGDDGYGGLVHVQTLDHELLGELELIIVDRSSRSCIGYIEWLATLEQQLLHAELYRF